MYYLYLKIHDITRLRYLGYTTKNPNKYSGSGTYWKRHLNKHGYNISTTILLKTEDYNKIVRRGKYFSKIWNVVESEYWANLKEEAGIGGTWKGLHGPNNPMYGTKRPEYVIQALRKSRIGKKNTKLSDLNKSRKGIPRTEEVKKKISETKRKKSKN